jgi:DNA-binding LytR/AlgR family response regulator
MPGGMTGRELARVIADRYPGLPIRLATGFERVKVDDSVTSGVVKQDASVLRKPYTRGELLSCIESALN